MNREISNLIIVPGHAAFRETIAEVPVDVTKDEHWALQSFQTGEPAFYVEHIQEGVRLLGQDPESLLLLSGGRTRPDAGAWSEAATYRAIAESHRFWESDERARAELEERVGIEPFARDSLENLQYSVARFQDLTSRYPGRITIVGWSFKQPRFDLHRETLGIPEEHFTYIGLGNPDDLDSALAGEQKTLEAFRADPWAALPPLSTKREGRNPFNQQHPYA